MLTRLSIRNYAIIDELELHFSPALTAITGETGAGKSIVMEALLLALGARAEGTIVLHSQTKCTVEAEFIPRSQNWEEWLIAHDLDAEQSLILRREISANGKSRAFINDSPVLLSLLRECGEMLVDMHHQQESQMMSSTQFQLTLLDSLAGINEQTAEFEKQFRSWKQKLSNLAEMKDTLNREMLEIDFLKFQHHELQQAELKANELEQLEGEWKLQQHASSVSEALQSISYQIQQDEQSILQQIKSMNGRLSQLSGYYPAGEQMRSRLLDLWHQLNDLAKEMETDANRISTDGEKLQQLTDRIHQLNNLLHKYRLPTIEALIAFRNEIEQKISSIHFSDEQIKLLEKETEMENKNLIEQAQVISLARQKQISPLVKKINTLLPRAGLMHATIRIDHQTHPDSEMNSSGIDQFSFLFQSNAGSPFMAIGQVASGGELSRLMLCFKSLIAASTKLPTLIFDEIDSGISGETANQVARILQQLSQAHQVICITHLPQIASKANVHFFVSKETRQGKTKTVVKELTDDEKIKALAHMISGEKITSASLQSAREMLN